MAHMPKHGQIPWRPLLPDKMFPCLPTGCWAGLLVLSVCLSACVGVRMSWADMESFCVTIACSENYFFIRPFSWDWIFPSFPEGSLIPVTANSEQRTTPIRWTSIQFPFFLKNFFLLYSFVFFTSFLTVLCFSPRFTVLWFFYVLHWRWSHVLCVYHEEGVGGRVTERSFSLFLSTATTGEDTHTHALTHTLPLSLSSRL